MEESVFINGPTPASFVYFHSFQQHFFRKIVDFKRIWTQIVGVEGEHADHPEENVFLWIGDLIQFYTVQTFNTC